MTPRKSNSLLRKLGFWSVILSLPLLLGTHLYRTRCKIEWAHEGSTKGNCGAIKSAISIYYGDHNGIWPKRLDQPDFLGKYIDEIPRVRLSHFGHPDSNMVETFPFLKPNGDLDPTLLRDTGHWLYDSATGTVAVDCTHRDDRGRPLHGMPEPDSKKEAR